MVLFFPKCGRLGCPCDKLCTKVLHLGWILARGPFWLGYYVVFFVRGRQRTSMIPFGDMIFPVLFGVVSLRHLAFIFFCSLVGRRSRSFFFFHLSMGKECFRGRSRFGLFCGICGAREIIESSGKIFYLCLVAC